MAVIGGVTAVLVAVISAVQMALDGVALKATIDTWTNASQAADKASAYQVAVGMRVGSVFCALRGVANPPRRRVTFGGSGRSRYESCPPRGPMSPA